MIIIVHACVLADVIIMILIIIMIPCSKPIRPVNIERLHNVKETHLSLISKDLMPRTWIDLMASSEKSSKLLQILSMLNIINSSRISTDSVLALHSIMDDLDFQPLDANQVDNVEKFVMFAGYPRSGHSIIGTMLDSHPNMIIANEFPLIASLLSPESRSKVTKQGLFNALYLNSLADMVYGKRGVGGLEKKGYILAMNGSFQGRFSGKLTIIGNKKGGAVGKLYHDDPVKVVAVFNWLKTEVGVPIRVIHVVRNPYDMVATHTLYLSGEGGHKYAASEDKKLNNPFLIKQVIKQFSFRAMAVTSMTNVLDLDVLLIRHEDLVNDPKKTMTEICEFLDIHCTADYLESCKAKTYPSISRTRDLIEWTQHLQDLVDLQIKQFHFFKGYTFNS